MKMKKQILKTGAVLALLATVNAYATNGDNLEGIGAVSEALGGTGIAAPQDALSAIVNNPSSLGFTPAGKKTEFTTGLTLFQPSVSAKIGTPAGTLSGDSKKSISYIPSLAIDVPLNDQLNFGFGAYGVSGLGVDYRGKKWDLDGNPANGYEGDVYTKFGSLKLAPALSYKVNPDFAIGVALNGNYSTLTLGQGEKSDLSFGAQVGALYKIGAVQIGASYTTPQKAKFEKVYNFDAFSGDTHADTLTLEQPASYAAGISWQANDKLLLELDAKYLAWADAEGYGDFDWKNQWVYGLGAQYKATDKLTARAGFNYGENPVNQHNGWNPQGLSTVQGKQVPTFGYELLRNVGFPAIVESHLTLGFGYQLTANTSLNVAYLHAFENDITSTSAGGAINFRSTLSEDSVNVGINWQFD